MNRNTKIDKALGRLELYILIILRDSAKPLYGLEIQKEIYHRLKDEPSFYTPSLISIYGTLSRLQDKGFIVSASPREIAESRGSRKKLFFKLNSAGRRVLQEQLDELSHFIQPPHTNPIPVLS